MAAKAEILGEGPGIARIRVSGITTPAAAPIADYAIQIQRNQSPDSYLGLNGQWQASPDCWHPLAARDITAVAGGIEFLVGQQFVDPILTVMAQNAFRLTLRAAEGSTTTALVPSTQHPLLASSARHEAPVISAPIPQPKPVEPPAPVVPPAPPTILKADPADQFQAAAPALRSDPPPPAKSRKGILLVGIAAIVLLSGAAVAAYLHFKPLSPPKELAAPAPAAVPQSTREILEAFMKGNPDATTIVSQADKMKSDGNIDAAVYLYRQGTDHGDAHSALQLGMLYDPGEAGSGASTLTKSSDTAAFWYGKAADAGLAEAQRRLGILLIKSHAADTDDYKNGITLLKAAGKQGDADATAKLKELGQ